MTTTTNNKSYKKRRKGQVIQNHSITGKKRPGAGGKGQTNRNNNSTGKKRPTTGREKDRKIGKCLLISITTLLVIIVKMTTNKQNDRTNYTLKKNIAYSTTHTKTIIINKIKSHTTRKQNNKLQH